MELLLLIGILATISFTYTLSEKARKNIGTVLLWGVTILCVGGAITNDTTDPLTFLGMVWMLKFFTFGFTSSKTF